LVLHELVLQVGMMVIPSLGKFLAIISAYYPQDSWGTTALGLPWH
jgi:hypothetical protein